MAVQHANFVALAKRLIAKNGRSLTFKKLDRAPADSTKPWRAGAPTYTESHVQTGVVVGYTDEETAGTSIKRDDLRILVDAASVPDGVALEDFDMVLDGTRVLSIVKTDILQPGDTRILYDIQARG